jgi:hypothetical protein
MKSDHIDTDKLHEIVEERNILDAAEIQHLGECEECMEMIRFIVRQKLSKGAGH